MEKAAQHILNNYMCNAHVLQNWNEIHIADKNELASMGAKFIKNILKPAGLAFFIAILLVGPWVGDAKAQSLVETTPKQLAISGIIGTSSFQHPFTLHAVNESMTELTFSSSNLLEITGGKSWITGANIQITPAVTRINRGQNQDFIVTVQNIPESGRYEGIITISYKEQLIDVRDTLPISVQASKFSASPPQIILKFEKSIRGKGGSVVPWTMALNEYSGRAPQEMITTLTKNTSVGLDPLVNNEDKSQIIRPEQLLFDQPVISETRSQGQGLTINANFANPEVPAGKYSGALTVRSGDMGILAIVPIEVQVRHSSLLAWLLISLGIIASLLVNWWNTTGKKKNAIRRDALEEREKLDNAEITETCRKQIKGKLDEVGTLLDDDNFDKAEKNITDAVAFREKCVGEKKKLNEKITEVTGLINDLEKKVAEPLKLIVGTDAPVIKTYLPNIKKDIETIKKDIEQEKYLSVDDALNQKVADLKKKLDDFISQAPNGLLDGLMELEEDLKRLDQEYRPALDLQPIREHLGAIVRDKDVDDVSGEIKEAGEQLKKVVTLSDKLKDLRKQIEYLDTHGINVNKANEELEKCKGYLATGNISMAEGRIQHIENAIVEAPRQLLTHLTPISNKSRALKTSASSYFLTNFDLALDIKDPQERSTKMLNVLSNVLESGGLTEDDEIRIRAMQNLLDTRVESEDKAASVFKPSALYQLPSPVLSEQILSEKQKPNLLNSLGKWWTPERQELAIGIVLFLIAIPVLAVIGFGQLYANNPIFGAKNVWEEYLALFLWGFGIQTGTATVAGVLKAFRGS